MARATCTAQSMRPSSRNSRVPLSGSTIQSRPVAGDVLESLLRAHRVVRVEAVELVDEELVGLRSPAAPMSRRLGGAARNSNKPARPFAASVRGVAVLGGEVVGHRPLSRPDGGRWPTW